MLQDKPWIAPIDSHDRAAKYWRESTARKTKDPTQKVSLQAWQLYMVRFIFTGGLTDSRAAFGGISAQFPHLCIVLLLAAVETEAFALAYDRELRLTIQGTARKRERSIS